MGAVGALRGPSVEGGGYGGSPHLHLLLPHWGLPPCFLPRRYSCSCPGPSVPALQDRPGGAYLEVPWPFRVNPASSDIPVPRSPQVAGGGNMPFCSRPEQGLINLGTPTPPEEEAQQPPRHNIGYPTRGAPYLKMTQINHAFLTWETLPNSRYTSNLFFQRVFEGKLMTWCAYSQWLIWQNTGFLSSSEKQISFPCPFHSQTPTVASRRHNTRIGRINSISVTFYSALSKSNLLTGLFSAWGFHGKNLVTSCLSLGLSKARTKCSLSWDLAFFFFLCLMRRPGHTLQRCKRLCKVGEKLALFRVIHRKNCFSYLFLLRKWMMHEIIKNSLWANLFSTPPHSCLWRISDPVQILFFMIGMGFFKNSYNLQCHHHH